MLGEKMGPHARHVDVCAGMAKTTAATASHAKKAAHWVGQ